MFRSLVFSVSGLLMILILSCSSCKKPEDEIQRINLNTYTSEDQLAFGDNFYNTLRQYPDGFPLLDPTQHVDVLAYMNALYRTISNTNLVENRDLFTWEVSIVNDNTKRMAFVAPGGRFYIYTGLLKYLKGEHELASIMAHEIYYSDSGKNMSALQDNFASEPFLLGDIYLGHNVPEVLDVVKFLSDAPKTAEEVAEADHFALENICPFAYNAIGLKQILDRAIGDGGIAWSTTRPVNAARLEMLDAGANTCSNIEEDPTFSERYFSFTDKLP